VVEDEKDEGPRLLLRAAEGAVRSDLVVYTITGVCKVAEDNNVTV
jgi:hypothetical protein